jgi:hypothetical protein
MDWVLSIENYLPLCTENIELHAPTSSIQKRKLMGRGGQFTYIPTLPLTWRLPQTLDMEYERVAIILFNCAN